jgi:large subunit ribosomal protein L18
MESRHVLRLKRKARIRAKITGTADRPRLSVFRSNQALYAQLIDDTKGVTIVSSMKKSKTKETGKELGTVIAKLAQEKGIKVAVFDRDGYRFHGAIKEIADAARAGGLKI